MSSKACQLLNEYLLNDLVYIVEAYNPEMLLCDQLIDMINDNRISTYLNPGASRIGFKHFIVGPFMKMPGWKYITPLVCVLLFLGKTDDSSDLKAILNKLDQVDDIQILPNIENQVVCDTSSMLYQHLNHHNLIEKAVPSWYREN